MAAASLAVVGCVVLILWLCATSAQAGTYPMYQCAPGVPAVSPGWSVFGNTTNANTVLSNGCSAGGSIGDYVFTDGQAGAVTENGESGSQVGLRIDVPGSAPGVTIHAIKAEVIASTVTGDDAFLEFASAGQSLPGAAELPYGGGSAYTATETWTLPQSARDFEAYVNCSTDRSSPTCDFADSTAVPALANITLSLEDDTPPTVEDVSGPLAAAAAADTPVAGSQPISFTGSDAGSGVHTATLTLSPLSGGASYVHTFDFSGECAYDSWNACPLTETVSGFTVNTDALADGAYAASLAVTDAAGNVTNDALGSITVSNAAATVSSLGALPGPGTTSSATGPAGSPNGSGASEGAHLQLGVRSPISRTYAKRALRVTGRLLNAQGLPIAGASLDVLQQVDGATLELIGRARTGSDGTFVASVPGGPSRTGRDRLSRVLNRHGLRGRGEARRVRRRRRAAWREPPKDRLGRRDHVERARARAGPVSGRRRRAARPLPRALGAVPRSTHRLTRAVPGRLPIPGRSRAVPIPCGGVREPGRLPICTRSKQGGRCHHEVSSADTSCPERWSY